MVAWKKYILPCVKLPKPQTQLHSSTFTDYAKATATQKALEVATRLEKDERIPFMVIGADTVVEAPDGTIMEKPKVWTLTVRREKHSFHKQTWRGRALREERRTHSAAEKDESSNTTERMLPKP